MAPDDRRAARAGMETKIPRQEASVLAKIRDVCVIAGVYTYFMGWSYLTYYFRYFGISLANADTSPYSVVAISANVLAQPHAIWAKVFAVGCIAAVWGASIVVPPLRPRLPWIVAILAFPLIQLVAFYSAEQIARARMQNSGFSRVQFEFEKELRSGDVLAELAAANASRQLCLVTQTPSRYYVLRCSLESIRERHVFEIPSDLVRATVFIPEGD